MTQLQRMILDTLDNRGGLHLMDLEAALEVTHARRGGFRGSVMLLDKAGLIDVREGKLYLTGAGVRAVEAANVAEEAKG